MTTEQIAHDLTVAIVAKDTLSPSEAVTKYLDLLPQIKKAYEAEITKRGLKTGIVPR